LSRSQSIYWLVTGSLFHLSKGAVNEVHKRSLTERLPRDRPSFIANEHIEFITIKVQERFEQKQPMSDAELLNELNLELGTVLLRDTLRHIIAPLPFCTTMAGIPQKA
jgi:hypothetical protein